MMTRALLVTLLLAGCGELPEPVVTPTGDHDADPRDGDTNPNDDAPPSTPHLSPTPDAVWGYATMPLRGEADPHATIFVEGGQAPVATDADALGRFCVDVPLKPNVSQFLSVFAQNVRGVTSVPARFSVEHDPSLAESELPEQPFLDVALGKRVFSDWEPKVGDLSNLTDGDLSTSVTVMASYVWIDFGEVLEVSEVELVFPDALDDGDTFATEYVILTAEGSAPGEPDVDSPGWTVQAEVIYPEAGLGLGDGGIDSVPLAAPARARFVAVSLIENDAWDMGTENITVSELRVFARVPGGLAPEPQTPTCGAN